MAQEMTVNPDALYDTYGKNLYRITNDDQQILNTINADPSASNVGQVQVPASDLGGGVGTATTQNASGSDQAGKQTYSNTDTGYILGVDPKDGLAKFYIGDSTHYINWDGVNLTIVGGVSVSSLNIPDTTTANSFHVDTSGNAWWGANVATGYTGANAYILSTGAAVFKNVQIGGSTIQYVITNSGIFSYGDGSDGAAVLDGSATPAGMTKSGSNYTMTRDVYYTDMTMSTGTTLNPNGYRIFGNGVLTMNGTAVIKRNGNDGGAGSTGTTAAGGTGGASLPDGYLKGSLAGGVGGAGTSGGSGLPGTDGTPITNSIGSAGVNAGSGDVTATPSNVKLIANWHLATLLDVSSTGSTVKFTGSASSGGGPGTPINGGSSASGGGGASAGGIVAIYFRSIVIGASASITANGGNGGNGGTRSDGARANGGGGGSGGVLVLVYNQISNAGSLLANAGIGGTGFGGGGQNGHAGVIYQFQLSL